VTVLAGPEHWAKNKPVPDGYVTAAAFADVITYRMLDYWTHAGYLRAADDGPGTGQNRLWPESEVAVARAIRRLIDAGLSVNAAVRIARDGPHSATLSLADGVTLAVTPELWEAS
jgi:hypothetical protein